MKKIKIIGGILGTIVGVFIGSALLTVIFAAVMLELGCETTQSKIDRQNAKEICEVKGGTFIVNPHSYIQHRAFGEGCSVDYAERAAKQGRK